MLEEVQWCKKMKHKHFNQDMILTKMMNEISRMLINVILATKSTL